MKPDPSLWLKHTVGGTEFDVLNLDHPDVETRVMAEMAAGVAVYYDTRWQSTTVFSDWIGDNPDFFRRKRVLAIGAGVGFENLLLASVAEHLILNDFAPVSVDLCAEQLAQNGFTNFEKLPGDFTQIPLPDGIDLVVACFLVYHPASRRAIEQFLDRFPGEVILVNEFLPGFRQFMKACPRQTETLCETDRALAVRLLAEN